MTLKEKQWCARVSDGRTGKVIPLSTGATHGLAPDPGDRLDSWKEIASYLRRDVRTLETVFNQLATSEDDETDE